MTTATSQLLYTPAPDKTSLVSSIGGAFIKPDDRPAFNLAYKNRVSEAVALTRTCRRLVNEHPSDIALVFETDEPTATGHFRIEKLSKPFDIKPLGMAGLLLAANITTYYDKQIAIAGKHWLVVDPTLFDEQMVPRFNADDLDKSTVRLSINQFPFTSFCGTIDGHKYTDIFVVG